MADLTDILKETIKTGYQVLVELDNKEPDVEKIQELYRRRSALVDKLELFSDDEVKVIPADEEEEVRNLFTRLELLEKELNKKLFILSNAKQKAIRQVRNHKQAAGTYSEVTEKYNRQGSQIVDIVDNR